MVRSDKIPKLHVLYFLLNAHKLLIILFLYLLILSPDVLCIVWYYHALMFEADTVHFLKLFLSCHYLTRVSSYCIWVCRVEALYESLGQTFLTHETTTDFFSSRVRPVHSLHIDIDWCLLVGVWVHAHELWFIFVIELLCLLLLLQRLDLFSFIRLFLETIFHNVH